MRTSLRNLVVVLGDQLDHQSTAFDGFDPQRDSVWMAEVEEELTHVWCHKLRIAYFLSSMRHFRDDCRQRGWTVHYHAIQPKGVDDRGRCFGEVLTESVRKFRPEQLVVVQPGDQRVHDHLVETAASLKLPIDVREDTHFYCSMDEFRSYSKGRSNLVLEFFYREMRRRHDVLMDGKEPVSGKWNFDHDNRESFGRNGPQDLPKQRGFRLDDVTRGVIELVEQRFGDHPGRLDHFTLPVTRRQARNFLQHFIEHILPDFGQWEDAMWEDEAFLYHSRLSAPLNSKLLSPRECVDAAVAAYEAGKAPLNSVEGFVRQILGWREFVRGVYWLHMPEYITRNHLGHERELPSFFWDGETDMACVRDSMQHVLNHGYSHHIHRLMVLGNFAQLWGVHPRAFHDWHMAMYLDAIDWVSLPNTLGMSQYGDGGIVGTKPYCSSGNYINKMGNFCRGCRFDYKKRVGDDACPFTTLYWEFMDRNYDLLKDNARMKFPIRNVEKLRLKLDEMNAIRDRAAELREEWSVSEKT